jgi:hypothetical protein
VHVPPEHETAGAGLTLTTPTFEPASAYAATFVSAGAHSIWTVAARGPLDLLIATTSTWPGAFDWVKA